MRIHAGVGAHSNGIAEGDPSRAVFEATRPAYENTGDQSCSSDGELNKEG